MEKYVLGETKIKQKIILMTGTSRTGKTLLSRLLASHSNVEWIEEPIGIASLVEMRGLDIIDRNVFKMLFSSMILELINDNVLLRNGNFRPEDMSTVWNYKSAQNIFDRLHTLKSRDDVQQYLKKNDPYYILDIPDILPFTNEIREVCENIIVINVVRNGYDVADACYKKQWFEDGNTSLTYNNLFRRYKEKLVHWWIPEGKENEYISAPVYERGIMYWMSILSQGCVSINEVSSRYDVMIRYEDFSHDAHRVLLDLKKKIDIKPTDVTSSILASIVENYEGTLSNRNVPFRNIDNERFVELMMYFGYCC